MRQKLTLLALFLSVFALGVTAQDRTVSGKVTSSDDKSTVPGVSVVVVGTTIGTSTDMDGNYRLTVPSGTKSLRFSGVGMKTKEVAVGASNNVDITLDPACKGVAAGKFSRFERTFCMKPCSSDGDCRDQYQCVDLSDPAMQAALRGESAGVPGPGP